MEYRENGALTKRYEEILVDLDKNFEGLNLYYKGDFALKIEELKEASEARKRELKADLREMFENSEILCKTNQEDQYYINLYKKSKLPNFYDLENQILIALYKVFTDYLTPSQYMHKLVMNLSEQNDIEKGDTVRLLILKRFIKYCNYAGYNKVAIKNYIKKKTGNDNPKREFILTNIDDDIFKLLKNSGRDYANEYGVLDEQNRDNHLEILSVSNDLADGNFRTNGKSIEMLYKFAVAFNMTYYSYAVDEIFNYERDIERNLFENYYNNNLMRYVEDNYLANSGSMESEPLGRGINYKNYAEVVYLYYISHNSSPEEKFLKIKEKMKEVRKGMTGNGQYEGIENNKGTQYFRFNVQRRGLSDSILDLDEPEFCSYLKTNYTLDQENVSPFKQACDQNTAYEVFQKIIKKCELKKREGIWFIDTKETVKKVEDLKNQLGDDYDEERMKKLLSLLSGIDSFIRDKYGKGFEEIKKENVSRTAMITAYYYFFNEQHKFDEKRNHISFKETFAKFKEGVDPFLVDAYYQPLSVKNIFDVIVGFSAYAKLVL